MPSQENADTIEQSGIYSLSMTGPDMIGNRISGMDNAFCAPSFSNL